MAKRCVICGAIITGNRNNLRKTCSAECKREWANMYQRGSRRKLRPEIDKHNWEYPLAKKVKALDGKTYAQMQIEETKALMRKGKA